MDSNENNLIKTTITKKVIEVETEKLELDLSKFKHQGTDSDKEMTLASFSLTKNDKGDTQQFDLILRTDQLIEIVRDTDFGRKLLSQQQVAAIKQKEKEVPELIKLPRSEPKHGETLDTIGPISKKFGQRPEWEKEEPAMRVKRPSFKQIQAVLSRVFNWQNIMKSETARYNNGGTFAKYIEKVIPKQTGIDLERLEKIYLGETNTAVTNTPQIKRRWVRLLSIIREAEGLTNPNARRRCSEIPMYLLDKYLDS